MDNLSGVWIGETVGEITPLHRWVVVQRGHVVTIYSRYSLENRFSRFEGTIDTDGQHIQVIRADGLVTIPLDGRDQFTVPGWVYKRKRDGEAVPMYDVFFRRRDTGPMKWFVAALAQVAAGTPRLMEMIG